MNRGVLGFDIGEQYSQAALLLHGEKEPVCINYEENEDSYLLPNIACYKEHQLWYSLEANEMLRLEEGDRIGDILKNVRNHETVVLDGAGYLYQDIFISLIMEHVKQVFKHLECLPEKIVFTLYDINPNMLEALEILKKEEIFQGIEVLYTGYQNSLLSFVLNQENELWSSNVASFYYGPEGMQYFQINFTKRNTPLQIQVKHKDYKEKLDYSENEKLEKDEIFKMIASDAIGNSCLSSVFLCGTGFENGWAKESLKFLCNGRRVFLGQNLFAFGACYYGMDEKEDILVNSSERIQYDIGIIGYDGTKEQMVLIARGGKEWFDVKGVISVFLNDTKRIEFIYVNRFTNERIIETVEVGGLPKRPPRTTKLELTVEFYDKNTGAIVIRDKGFGKLFPTTNKIYRKEFTVIKDV